MPPPPPRFDGAPATATAMEEEDWVKALEAIVERDFFPEIPKLQSKLEWMRAVNSGNLEWMKQAQRNTMLRRAGVKTPLAEMEADGGSEAGENAIGGKEWATPRLHSGEGEWDEKALSNDASRRLHQGATPSALPFEAEDLSSKKAPDMSLDEFCRKYTSEDNASFSQILERTNAKIREKRERLHGSIKRLESGKSAKMLEAPSCATDGYGSSNQPLAGLVTWESKPLNPLFFRSSEPGSLKLTDKEKETLFVKGPEKQIVHANTRLSRERPSAGEKRSALASPSTSVSNTPVSSSRTDSMVANPELDSLRGYRYMRTPSFSPGRDESPFITWGEVEGTPIRLPEDDGIGAGTGAGSLGDAAGPSFRIDPVSEREEVAHKLGKKAAQHLGKRRKGKRTPFPVPVSPSLSGTPYGGKTPRRFSQAGMRLISKLRKGTPTRPINSELRASYTPSSTPTPHRSGN